MKAKEKRSVRSEPAIQADRRSKHDGKVVGHSGQREFLKKLLSKKQIPSTLLFSGPDGIGKRLVAYELARSLFCETNEWGGCHTCKQCMVFKKGNLPDFYELDFASDTQGTVEHSREIIHSLQLKSFSGSKRVVVFDNTEEMTPSIANLLLKTLEEPRPNTFFVLITTSKARLLPTLLSRCQSIFFESLRPNEMEQVALLSPELFSGALSSNKKNQILQWADGSCSGLYRISAHIEAADQIHSGIEKILNGSMAEALALAQFIAKDKERAEERTKLLLLILRGSLYDAIYAPHLSRLSFAVQNTATALRLMSERHLSPYYLITTILTQLFPMSSEDESLLLEEVVA